METQIKNLHFKWTVSRGRDTYGYNICSLWIDGYKVASCSGGGYDMKGTCLGDWLQNEFQNRLKQIVLPVLQQGDRSTFYGSGWNKEKNSVYCDGAAGFSSMRRIGEAIGITLEYDRNSEKSKNSTWYTAFIRPIQTDVDHA